MYELMVSPEVAGYILAVKEKLHHTTATETVAFLLDIRFNQLDTDLLPLTPVATTQRLRVYLRERHAASLTASSSRFGVAPGHFARVILVQLFSQDPLLLGVSPKAVTKETAKTPNIMQLTPVSETDPAPQHAQYDATASFDSLLS